MQKSFLLATLAAGLLAGAAVPAQAAYFNRIASFAVADNLPDAEATSSEIVTATEDGMTLVYSDSPGGGIGFIDITDPTAPQGAGYIAFEGEPTAVVAKNGLVFVGVNTSESFADPSGSVAVVDVESRNVVATCDIPGQPDSLAISPDGSLLAIAIENERDEDLNDGEIPQLPSGSVAIFSLTDEGMDCDSLIDVDLTGLAEIAGEDPEPEFIDFNADNEIVVSLQENNHFAIIDGGSGEVVEHFSAGAVDLDGIDTDDDGVLSFTDRQSGVLREPDAVKWLGTDRFVASNEGDYNGGSRGFTIYNRDGSVAYESGVSMEYTTATLGHYPEGRSDNKGIEPEGMEVASFGEDTFIFVLQERSSLVGVYRDTGGEPEYLQSIPSGVAPEGAVAIPERNLFVTANEDDLREDGLAGSHVMIFELRDVDRPDYPQIVSAMDDDGTPIGWVALSGLVADADAAGVLYAVNDSYLSQMPSIYTIDATQSPAVITEARLVTREGEAAQALDLEGITLDGEGGFWLASEGRTDRDIPHMLYRVDAEDAIVEEVPFPESLLANEIRFGAEGISFVGEGEDKVLWIAIQREWEDDPTGLTKLVSYMPSTGEWGAVHYPLETPADGAWVGLSEITIHGDYAYVVERDNQIAENAELKKLFRVAVSELDGAEIGSELPVVSKEEVHDFLPDLQALNGYVLDKVEGFAIDADGTGWVVTDNDGVDDSSGETNFWSIGQID